MDASIHDAMNMLTQGVYVIGTHDRDKVNGMTAAWLTQISSSPATLLVAVGRKHHTSEMIEASGAFSVNVLKPEQDDIARHFGFVSGRTANKLEGFNYYISKMQNPMLEGVAANLDCKLREIFYVGDHVLFVGEVIDAKVLSDKAKIYREAEFFG